GYFDVSENGNFSDEATGQPTGLNVLFLKESFLNKVGADTFFEQILPIQKKLNAVRSRRTKPGLDNKILTDWNSLMAASFLKAGRAFENKLYVQVGLENIEYVTAELKLGDHLFHRICDGELQKHEFLDDQASFIWALIHAYEATVDK